MSEEEFEVVFGQGYDEGTADGFWYGAISGVVATSIVGLVVWLIL